ncbi:MAG: hypothetical protein AAF642_07455, partial [Pseudomonadota bacterium]
PVASRVSQIRGWGWFTQAPATGSNIDALATAKVELDTALAELRQIEAGIASIEDRLEGFGAPFTPNSGVPSWRRAD